MNVFLDQQRWKEVFAGFEIVDVAIRDRKIIQCVARKKMSNDEASLLLDSQVPSRLITLIIDRPAGDNCGCQELAGMSYPVVGVSRVPFPRPSGLISSMNRDGDVWPLGGGSGPMEQIDPGRFPGTRRLKCIAGYTYSVGVGRGVYKRVNVGKWTELKKGLPDVEVTTNLGFSDIDAFSETDMYAVGGHGDVWHYDGDKWTQLGFPSNVRLATVTCAGDGNVYISGEGGSLWVGQKSVWKPIYTGGSSILWNDVLWFQDRLWLASDYQFRQWNGKELVLVEHEGKAVPISGHMDAYDGVLVIASAQYVMLFDGTNWRTLVAPYV